MRRSRRQVDRLLLGMILGMMAIRKLAGNIGIEAMLNKPFLGGGKRLSSGGISTSFLSASRPSSVAIIGGGLAGLSTAFHLLDKAPNTKITIFDKKDPGLGGASSVAGGLLHPLSPKGKLVHLGLEGLAATNRLLEVAKTNRDCIFQDEIYRVAVTQEHVATLKETAKRLPDLTEWLEAKDLPWDCPTDVLGGLRLHSGCKVVHMPSYLQGLWEAIQSTGSESKAWRLLDQRIDKSGWKSQLEEFDAVALCAGSGLFHDGIIEQKLPMQLVRGQSIEMTLGSKSCDHSMLCGKYVSPLPEKNRVLIGATHEFKETPLDSDQVKLELYERSRAFASNLWEDGTIDRITSGFRVQSNRGLYGRIPIVGKLDSTKTTLGRDTWIYTGLSSRGLLHHGVFGEILASTMLGMDSEHDHPGLDWWQNK